ncbi:HAMP domain-containing histidine kinase [Aerococcaceae bacterium DSM 111020]|nr:HAMP domain-containing histidine kinase [Aerococcaceae bacterium DSM 111020]
MAELKEKLKQPLSLRWKWGILLFAIAALLNVLLLFVLYTYSSSAAREDLEIEMNQGLQSITTYLESSKSSFLSYEQMQDHSTVGLQLIHTQQRFLSNLAHFEHDRFGMLLFSNAGDVIYQTKDIQVKDLPLADTVQTAIVNDQETIGVQVPVSSDTTGQVIGELVMVMDPDIYQKRMYHPNKIFLIAGIVMTVIHLISAFLISHYFFRPLNYLNSALDRVEEESLSDIRVRKPETEDEWSDLSLHVNRLLDRIDLYVTNQKQFVEDVSHELRTPVAIVEGHLKMLNRWGKDDPEVLENSIAASLQEMSRMKNLVQEMLDLSRADHVDVDYRDEITEIYSVTEQVFQNFDMLYDDFEFYLDMDQIGKQPLYVRMYRNHYEQILIILLDNAVKYSQNRKEVLISVSRSVTQVEIAVQDFGEGMSEKDKNKVFGRFYRVDKARSRDKGGNGLGLSIAKQLVNSYRGDIWVDSVENEGSIFYIDLPILKDDEKIEQLKQLSKKNSEH